MVEIITGRRSRVIGMGVVVSDHAEPSAARIIIGAFVLLRRDQITGLSRFVAFILGCAHFCKDINIALAFAQKKPATFVWVGLLAVLADLIEMFGVNLDRH